MRRPIENSLNTILESSSLFEPASEALGELHNADEALNKAKKKLDEEVDTINSQLALEIRRANPALNVSLTREGKCVVKYRHYNNYLTIKADPQNRRFVTGESVFDRKFRRYHGHLLESAPDTLGQAVAMFFKQNYKSIR